MAACDTAAAAEPSVATLEAAQPKSGAVSSRQRVPICDRASLLDARVVAHGGVGSGAQVRCCLRARWDRVSGGTLGGGPEGSVQPRSGALRARVTSWESSGALA
jgi:hypothetical protein